MEVPKGKVRAVDTFCNVNFEDGQKLNEKDQLKDILTKRLITREATDYDEDENGVALNERCLNNGDSKVKN